MRKLSISGLIIVTIVVVAFVAIKSDCPSHTPEVTEDPTELVPAPTQPPLVVEHTPPTTEDAVESLRYHDEATEEPTEPAPPDLIQELKDSVMSVYYWAVNRYYTVVQPAVCGY